jgi:hypothetical protein
LHYLKKITDIFDEASKKLSLDEYVELLEEAANYADDELENLAPEEDEDEE